MRIKTIVLSVISLLVILLISAPVSAKELPVVTGIEIKGLKRFEEGAVRAKISQKIGEQLSPEKASEDITAIYRMGYFDDVRVEMKPFEGGIKLIYVVKEKPIIISVQFQGNKKFRDDRLREKITLIPGEVADATLINDSALKLRAFYEAEGYYLVDIVPVVREVDEGEVVVTYQINEGERVAIREIKIKGNNAISTRKIRSTMETTERGIFSFIVGGGHFKKNVMRVDIARIKDLYHNEGFIEVIVKKPEIQLIDDKRGMRITIHISEGRQFKVSSVGITGNKAFSEEEIHGLIKLSPKQIFSKEILQGDIAAITELYSDSGYPFISVFPDIVPDEEKKEVKVIYRIDEGNKYRIGRIEIFGNIKTKDRVIRREMRLDEADVFDASALRRSHEGLRKLEFFEFVDISPEPVLEEKLIDLDITVKEKPTGFVSIGGGHSSIDGLVAMVELTERNLFGRGQQLRLSGEFGGRTTSYDISFREPWFMGKPISFGAGIYRTTREFANFNRRSTGFEISLGKRFWEYWGASTAYNFESVTIYDIEEGASERIREQEGTETTSSISLSLSRDTRDSFIAPSRGSRNVVRTTFAGLGGTNAFLKALIDSGWFFPVFDVTTIHLRGRAGYATGLFDKKLPLHERYYVGGIHTIRGLGHGDAGPLDINNEPIGGEKKLVFNAEYIFPIVPELRLKGVIFFDAGRAYDRGETFGSDLRYTAGAGVRWISPIGPLRIYWGHNLDRRAGEESSKIEFTIGAFF